MSFLNYNDIARISKGMRSKEIDLFVSPDERAEEFASLERAVCELLGNWLENRGAFPNTLGQGFEECRTELLRFVHLIVEFEEKGFEGFGGGSFGGGGASSFFGLRPGPIRLPEEFQEE